MNNLTVTIAIPTLNEAKTIRDVVVGFLNNTYEHILEIIITDGGSTDETVQIVKELSQVDSRIKIISNPNRIQSSGLNQVLEIAAGDLFLRADAHSFYSSTYVEECVSASIKSKAVSVGGAQRFVFKTLFQASIALLSRNLFGNGNAKYRNPSYSGFVDTVYLGCFDIKKLHTIGGYNGNLPINEDFDVNTRIRKRFGNKSIYLSESIVVEYLPRDSMSKFILQYFKYGLYKQFTNQLNQIKSIRSTLPPVVLLLFFISSFVMISQKMELYLVVFITTSLVALLFSLTLDILKRRFEFSSFKFFQKIGVIILSLILIIVQNISFSAGYFISLFISKSSTTN